MDTRVKPDLKDLWADKEVLRRVMDEVNQQLGIVHDPTITAEQVRALMLADGIRPEDNAFSREIIRMRYPDDEAVD